MKKSITKIALISWMFVLLFFTNKTMVSFGANDELNKSSFITKSEFNSMVSDFVSRFSKFKDDILKNVNNEIKENVENKNSEIGKNMPKMSGNKYKPVSKYVVNKYNGADSSKGQIGLVDIPKIWLSNGDIVKVLEDNNHENKKTYYIIEKNNNTVNYKFWDYEENLNIGLYEYNKQLKESREKKYRYIKYDYLSNGKKVNNIELIFENNSMANGISNSTSSEDIDTYEKYKNMLKNAGGGELSDADKMDWDFVDFLYYHFLPLYYNTCKELNQWDSEWIINVNNDNHEVAIKSGKELFSKHGSSESSTHFILCSMFPRAWFKLNNDGTTIENAWLGQNSMYESIDFCFPWPFDNGV